MAGALARLWRRIFPLRHCKCDGMFIPQANGTCSVCALPAPPIFQRVYDPEAYWRWRYAMADLQLKKAGQDFAAAIIGALEG
jgi:hypothetical protein